jgi:hypothetical protein
VATHSEADEVAQRVFALEDELVAMCRAQDAAEEKILSLAAEVAVGTHKTSISCANKLSKCME